ncbi:unnamed protein product [Closterium sp. NIES-53]
MASIRAPPLVATVPFLPRRSLPPLASLRVDSTAASAMLARFTSAKSQPSEERLRRVRDQGSERRSDRDGDSRQPVVSGWRRPAEQPVWWRRERRRKRRGEHGVDLPLGVRIRPNFHSRLPADADASPWEARRQSITFFTSDGVFQIHELAHVPVSTAPPAAPASSSAPASVAASHRFPERRYMDPQQGLCLASLFDIRAFNGLDASRLFCVVGFCRSPEMLSDVVADTVLMAGGEVVDSKLEMGQGLHEHLRLTVAVPYLFGVPPALDALNRAIRLGGGIVDKSFHQWEMCP